MSKFEVVSIESLTPNVLLLTVRPRKNNKFNFYPGQYAAMSFKRFGRPTPMRCFSIASSPTNPKNIQFAIRIQGDFTNAIKELKIGSRVNIIGPYGEFVIDETIDKNVILLAGGIGITPFMSMIRFAAETKLKIPIVLLYSCQTQNNVPFFDELKELEIKNSNFKVAFFITEGDTSKLHEARVVKGRIDEDALNQVTNNMYNAYTHFICGPIKFISALQSILISKRVSPDHLITEAFGQGLVTEKSHKPKSREARFVYAMTGVLLIIGTVFITGIDLARAVPKISRIENNGNNSTPSPSSSSTNSTNSTNSSGSSTNSSSGSQTNSSGTSTPSGSSTSNTTTQTTNNTPITRVS